MPDRPNILFLIMDDQRPDTLGPDSRFPVHTPNLDRLCAEGTRFDRHYVTTPICTPGRAEVLTGHHSYRNGVRWFGQPIKADLPLLPHVLQSAGYHTIHVGKWHNDGHPRDKGFDCVRRAMHDSRLPYGEHGHTMEWEEEGQMTQGHSTEMFCDAAIQEIKTAPENKPWFCYLALHSPHDPFQAPDEFLPDAGTLPDNFMPIYPWDNGDLTIRDELLLPFPRKPEAVREYRSRYAGMIQHHDHHLGRIFEHLRSTGEWDRTIVVFTSDHGLAVGDHGLLGKENMHEHSCRVPFVVCGPGIQAGRVETQLTHHTDFMPTLCHLAGMEAPVTDGLNLARKHSRDFICCGFTSPDPNPQKPLRETQRMAVTGQWKYIWYPQSNHRALYDLEGDPNETDNLLSGWRQTDYPLYGYTPPETAPDAKSIADELHSRLCDWGRKNGDPLFK
ncbi:MAG: sulfatase-like hydrolase/transferase [Puniceicoccaceae bacterium]